MKSDSISKNELKLKQKEDGSQELMAESETVIGGNRGSTTAVVINSSLALSPDVNDQLIYN